MNIVELLLHLSCLNSPILIVDSITFPIRNRYVCLQYNITGIGNRGPPCNTFQV